MVLNHRLKFCFIQNPKCASTYIAKCLQSLDDTIITGRKHGNSVDFFGRLRIGKMDINHSEYKIFTTIRHPISIYESLWAFSRTSPTSHVRRFFPMQDFDSFIDALLNLKAVPWEPRAFDRYFGVPISILEDQPYGWATFSAIHWTSFQTPSFSGIADNQQIKIFRIEDSFQDQINEYLGDDSIAWEQDKINQSSSGKVLNQSQIDLVKSRDAELLEHFGYK